MKEAELRKNTNCSICGKKIGHLDLPSFWTLTVQHMKIDTRALVRLQALTMALGGDAELASKTGPDEDLANKIGKDYKFTFCEAHTEKLFALIRDCKHSNSEEN